MAIDDDDECFNTARLFETFHDMAHIPLKYRALSVNVGSGPSVVDLYAPWFRRMVKAETVIVNDSQRECWEPQEVRHLSLCNFATIYISHRLVKKLISLKLLCGYFER